MVRDVKVSAVAFNGNPATQSVGALAGLNQGSIIDCSTGSAQTGFSPSSSQLTPQEVALMNATVEGLDAGGLVAVNSGQVLNCWSGADVRAGANGGHGGGLVGVAETGSSVWNAYALGNVYAGEQVGGLIGSNSGDVYNAYFAGTEVSGAQAGSFIGANHHDVFAAYAVKGVAGVAFGSGSAGDDPEAGLVEMPRESMAAQPFADQLNARVIGNMNWWAWSRDVNAGLPYQVKDPIIKPTPADDAPATGGSSALAPTGDGAAGWPAALGALLAAAAGAAVFSFRRLRSDSKRK